LVGAEYCGVATTLPIIVSLKINISLLYLGSTLLHTTKDDEMTKKTKGFTFESFLIFKYIHDSNCTKDYPIIIQEQI